LIGKGDHRGGGLLLRKRWGGGYLRTKYYPYVELGGDYEKRENPGLNNGEKRSGDDDYIYR